ncbi:metallophosphoesterase [Ulvibacterium sp.]|uniref:metallophosphoesterase n=1 Tax=Ulvibacterium sp. TaxID=2665914 RepID=UPI003BADB2FA
MRFGRRHFIKKTVLAVIGLLVIDVFWFEKYVVEWNVFDVSGGRTDKLKVIQLSDLHLRELKSVHKSLAKRINTEIPDVLFITGDAITRPRRMALLNDFLHLIDPKIQKIAILGNKEYSGHIDLDLLRQTYTKHHGTLLINESYVLNLKGRKVNILGIDDFVHGTPDINKSSENLNPSFTTIILSHCPVYRREIDQTKFAVASKPLILAGHTHGGQVTFLGRPIFMPYGCGDYIKGWYTNETSKMYVSKGIGTTSIPIRFGARAEANMFYV